MSMVEASFVDFFVAKIAEWLRLSSTKRGSIFLIPFPEKGMVQDGLPVMETEAAMTMTMTMTEVAQDVSSPRERALRRHRRCSRQM
jgi:hypothetical protein